MIKKPMVFSIRGAYVARILDGSKRYEFRSRRPKLCDGDTILIYETIPKKKSDVRVAPGRIVASAEVAEILYADPAKLYGITAEKAGIGWPDFADYFTTDGELNAIAFALRLREVKRLESSRVLPANMRAPQSWARWRGEWPLEGS
jgi:predicted transcriptional regulator